MIYDTIFITITRPNLNKTYVMIFIDVRSYLSTIYLSIYLSIHLYISIYILICTYLPAEQGTSLPPDVDVIKFAKAVLDTIGKKAPSPNSTHIVLVSKDEFVAWTKSAFLSKDISNVNAVFTKIIETINLPPKK